MKIKVCYNNETHRISKLPETFEALTKLISSIFLTAIPSTWRLEYVDSDGDKIMLADEQDYKEFIESECQNMASSNASVKIFIVPYDINQGSQILPKEESNQISDQNKDDDYNIINNSSGESDKEELKKEESQSSSEIIIGSDNQFKEDSIQEQPQINEVKEEAVIEDQKEKDMTIENKSEENTQSTEANHEIISSILKTEEQEEKKVEPKPEVIEPVPIQQPKVVPKKFLKPKAQPKADKPKEMKPKKVVTQKVVIKDQVLNKMIESAVQKNIAKIAMMTSTYLNNKASETQAQPQAQAQTQTQVQPQTQEKPQEEVPVHLIVKCDGCNAFPIRGIRYKCSVCRDFDFCERCEQEKEHPHAFIKVKYPGHAFTHKPFHHLPHFPHPPFHPPFFNHPPCKELFTEKIDIPSQVIELKEVNVELLKQPKLIQDIDSISMTTSEIFPIEKSEEKNLDVKEEPESKVPVEEEKQEAMNEEKEVAQEKEEVQEKEEEGPRVYSEAVQSKALQLKECLPDADMCWLLDFVENAPEDLDMEELLENFKY